MGDRLGQAVHGLWTHFLSALGWLFALPKRFLIRLAQAISAIVVGFGNRLNSLGWRIKFQFLKLIQSLTGLIKLVFVNPLSWLYRLVVRFTRSTWAFIGRCGLALRNLLNIFIWQPFLFLTWPLRWLYRKLFRGPLRFVSLSLAAFGQWFFVDLIWTQIRKLYRLIINVVETIIRPVLDLPNRFLPGRRSRLEERLEDYGSRQPTAQRSSQVAGKMVPLSARTRFSRLLTALVTTSIVLVLAVLTSQTPPASDVVAGNDFGQASHQLLAPLVPKMTLTPTVRPTQIPQSTPLPIKTASPEPTLSFWPTPDPLGSGGTLLFTARNNGNGDIYALAVGRPDPVRLTTDPADDRGPAWSPDGRRIAFSSHRDGNWEIYVLDLATGKQNRLTEDLAYDGAPSWSPDGLWLVFESYRNGNMDLFIINADDGSRPIRITENRALDYSPAWSPDGRHIAYTSWRSGNPDIFIMSLDTASDEAAVNITGTPDRYEDKAAFDSSGEFLAYSSEGDGLSLINVMPLEKDRPAGAQLALGRGHFPSWSPDDNTLAYVNIKEDNSFIIAGSLDRWSVAPQAYSTAGLVRDLDWSGSYLPRGLDASLASDFETEVALYTETITIQESPDTTFLLREIAVEAPSPYLTDKVDDSFSALRQRVIEEVGWDFLGQVDNMFSFLTSTPYPGEPLESWNKAARAFDFYHRYPMSAEPQVEIVREDSGGETYWRVFLKPAVQDGSRGEPLRQLSWDFNARYDGDPLYYDQGGKLKDEIPPGYYIDFTALASDFGWTRSPALPNWRTFFQGIRFWHYENRGDLTWEEAIQELYTSDELDQVYSNQ